MTSQKTSILSKNKDMELLELLLITLIVIIITTGLQILCMRRGHLVFQSEHSNEPDTDSLRFLGGDIETSTSYCVLETHDQTAQPEKNLKSSVPNDSDDQSTKEYLPEDHLQCTCRGTTQHHSEYHALF